jgi:hypothetical protein
MSNIIPPKYIEFSSILKHLPLIYSQVLVAANVLPPKRPKVRVAALSRAPATASQAPPLQGSEKRRNIARDREEKERRKREAAAVCSVRVRSYIF